MSCGGDKEGLYVTYGGWGPTWGDEYNPEAYKAGEWVTMMDGTERIVKKKKGGEHYFAKPTNKDFKARERMMFGGGMAYSEDDYESYKAGEWVTRMDGTECVIKKVGKKKKCKKPTNADYKKRERTMFGGNLPSFGLSAYDYPFLNYKDELALRSVLPKRKRLPLYLRNVGDLSYVDDFALAHPRRRFARGRYGPYGGIGVDMPLWEYDYLMDKARKEGKKAGMKKASAGNAASIQKMRSIPSGGEFTTDWVGPTGPFTLGSQ